jgi:hypothetical protein
MGDNQINSDGVLAIVLCIKANQTNQLREIDFSVKKYLYFEKVFFLN